jgi:predicted AAA+ superfamily ATPase
VGLAGAQIGNLLSESKIAAEIGLSRPTVKKYLHLLETTFVLDAVPPYARNLRREFVRMPKIFFKDTGLRNAIVGGFLPLSARADTGAVLENGAYLEIIKNAPDFSEVFFWRTKSHQEVDFILRNAAGEITPIEVKAYQSSKFRLSSSLRAFIDRYAPKTAVIACLTGNIKEVYKKTEIRSIVFADLGRFIGNGETG